MRLDDEHRNWLTLALVPGVGTAHFVRLLARFRTPANVLCATQGMLEEVVGPKLAQRITHYAEIVDLGRQERRLQDYGAALVTLDDPSYPVRLADIYSPPLALFVRGELHEADEHCVAIVGTRRSSAYGLRQAARFARELVRRGITVVSGMADGVDSAAHRGALEGGGRTIAVLGCGVDIVYPPSNAALMQQIIDHGAVVSEFEMGVKPSAGNFPHRNRIISGMTLGTLVIEAPVKSGALITARQAAEQGREVFALPGEVGMKNSAGPHALIREGAKLVETVEDILVELDLPAHLRQPMAFLDSPKTAECLPKAPPAALPDVSACDNRVPAPSSDVRRVSTVEKDVLAVLAASGSYVDEIAQACRISVSEALSSLTVLELKGLVRQFSGKRFAPR